MRKALSIYFSFFLVGIVSGQELEVRIKDICRVATLRGNQLMGYGLVVGLSGTGDDIRRSGFTMESIANLLEHFGIPVARHQLRVKNVAGVLVTAELGYWARPGDRIDVVVSAIGDAKSLEGGILLQTPLFGADKTVYAVAQGVLMNISKAKPTVARIEDGAIVERQVSGALSQDGKVYLSLAEPDFTTALRIQQAINAQYGQVANVVDGSLVEVTVPSQYQPGRIAEFIATIEGLPVQPDTVAKVVINRRTATVVIGGDVKISQVAIAHGKLSVEVGEEKKEYLSALKAGVTVDDIVKGLNAVGATPHDIIEILQAIAAAGGLHAKLIIM